LQRAGQTERNIEELAHKLGFSRADDLYIAAARGELNQRQFQSVARGGDLLAETLLPDEVQTKPSKPVAGNQGILIVGVDNLLTQLARCCKPAPPDEDSGLYSRAARGFRSTAWIAPILPTYRAASRAGHRDRIGVCRRPAYLRRYRGRCP
jgi:(p)ppGpp synthase/HD superfamily hydrolase